MAAEPTPRRSQRKLVRMTAQCRTQSGLRDTGYISDISPEGCCVSTNCLFFRVGTRVVIRPEGMEGLTGVVRWISSSQAGVEFDNPVYGPVIDHLAEMHFASKPVALKTY